MLQIQRRINMSNDLKVNIVIDQIQKDHFDNLLIELDKLKGKFSLRMRMKKDGRTSSSLVDLPQSKKPTSPHLTLV